VQCLVVYALSTRVAEEGLFWRWSRMLIQVNYKTTDSPTVWHSVESYWMASGGLDTTAFERHKSDAQAPVYLSSTSLDRDSIDEDSGCISHYTRHSFRSSVPAVCNHLTSELRDTDISRSHFKVGLNACFLRVCTRNRCLWKLLLERHWINWHFDWLIDIFILLSLS